MNNLRERQIDTMKPYSDIVEIFYDHYGYSGDCPVSEDIAKKTLVIPSNHSLKNRDAQRIARTVNAAYAEIMDY